MPCPAGVNIPLNFQLWNDYGIYGKNGGLEWNWKFNTSDAEKAKNCVGCGKCETLCPQKLAIRENLKRAQMQLDNLISI